MNEETIGKISKTFALLLSFFTIINLAVGLTNLYVTNTIRPLKEAIEAVGTQAKANYESLNNRIGANDEEHKSLVSKDEFGQVITRINYISGRVDQIFGIIVNRGD